MNTKLLLSVWVICLIMGHAAFAQDTALVNYTGKYIFPAGSAVDEADVTLEGQTLTISASLGTASLTRSGGDVFTIPQYNGRVEFLRDSSENIAGIKVLIGMADIEAEGKKVTAGNTIQTSFDLQAHQGGCGLWPCNTVEAFINAVKLGVNTLELDCVISKDSMVVVSHDQFMNSIMITPEGRPVPAAEQQHYNIFKMPYDSIRRYDAGSGNNPEFPGQQKIRTFKPLLSEVFDRVEEYIKNNGLQKVQYNIEIKSLKGDNVYHPTPDVFTDLVVKVIRDKKLEERVMIQSFDVRALQHLHTRYPQMRVSYLVSNKSDLQKNLERLGFEPDVYSPEYKMLDPGSVKEIRKTRMKLIPWTVDKEEDINRIINMGVDGIITNYPDRVLSILGKRS